MKKYFALMVVLAGIFCFSTNAFCNVPPVYQKVVSISYEKDENGNPKEMFKTTSIYDEQGLLTQRTVIFRGTEEQTTYTYEMDEHKYPCRIIEEGASRNEFTIENHYEGDDLTDAAVTDIVIDQESQSEYLENVPGPEAEDVDSEVFEWFETPLYCLTHYQGYHQMFLLSGPDRMHIKEDENEKSQFEVVVFPGTVDKHLYKYRNDGTITETITSESIYDFTEEESKTTVTDGDHYVTGFGESKTEDDDKWSGMLWYKYSEERTSDESGETYRSGTIDRTEGQNLRVSGPFGLFAYLNDAGEVIRTELKFDSYTSVTFYDGDQATARERYYDDFLSSHVDYYYFE